VLEEVQADLARPVPMARLLQGEVGSGKTAVAAGALLVAVAAGWQGVLMAPTEILAEQHARSLTDLYEHASGALQVEGTPIPRVALLVGSMTRKQKQEVYARAEAGEVDVLIGTHALIQEGVNPGRLGLVIVDEQHRFGVRQRLTLTEKGGNPHLLVMTATPIPRTLALSLYGDLDVSVLDEMPPGRQPVTTRLIQSEQRYLAYEFIRRQVASGRQAFVICPLVEGSEAVEAKAATEEFERLRETELRSLRLALLHGRMRPAEKESVMRDFRAGEFDVLVSTSVVEVGVDVPNATTMLIEGAERFGLAQLHQFRGRVGRGQHAGTCILLAGQDGATSNERLQAVVESSNGLELAERDLRLRGPGDYFGERQSGLPALRVATLSDLPLIERAREAARSLLGADPALERPEHAALRVAVEAYVESAAAPS
jgi:ATP-dependent DNA helicase RecG